MLLLDNDNDTLFSATEHVSHGKALQKYAHYSLDRIYISFII